MVGTVILPIFRLLAFSLVCNCVSIFWNNQKGRDFSKFLLSPFWLKLKLRKILNTSMISGTIHLPWRFIFDHVSRSGFLTFFGVLFCIEVNQKIWIQRNVRQIPWLKIAWSVYVTLKPLETFKVFNFRLHVRCRMPKNSEYIFPVFAPPQ